LTDSSSEDDDSTSMNNILASLDPVKITVTFFMLMYRISVNSDHSGALHTLKEELSVSFALRFLTLNAEHFKKTEIVKEFLDKIVDRVHVN
jgi:hypothetical protein